MTGRTVVGGNRGRRPDQLIADALCFDVPQEWAGKIVGPHRKVERSPLKLLWIHGGVAFSGHADGGSADWREIAELIAEQQRPASLVWQFPQPTLINRSILNRSIGSIDRQLAIMTPISRD